MTPPYYLILIKYKTLFGRSLYFFHFLVEPIWRFSVKFQGQKSIRSKNIDVLVKVDTSKSTNPIYFPYISNSIKGSIKWTVVMLITPNLASRHKMVIIFECVQKNSNIYCSHWFSIALYCSLLFFYCSLLFRTIGFPKIDKGTLITIFFFDFF